MTGDDPAGFAELWLSELGAHVPEYRDGAALAPRERWFGLGLPADVRAARNAARLHGEPSRARYHQAWRARSDPDGRE